MDSDEERRCVSCGRAAHHYDLDGCVNVLLAENGRLRDGIEAHKAASVTFVNGRRAAVHPRDAALWSLLDAR